MYELISIKNITYYSIFKLSSNLMFKYLAIIESEEGAVLKVSGTTSKSVNTFVFRVDVRHF